MNSRLTDEFIACFSRLPESVQDQAAHELPALEGEPVVSKPALQMHSPS